MRLHRLRITAFGPFSGSEDIDLDALADGGLFLLHGPTGAGKTSVLDAICFALYGQVPGDRGRERLRSDHAEPDRAPEVVCEFSVGDRRLTVTRSPVWQRPKKRGTGTTTAPAQVSVTERVDGAETVLTTRVEEAGQLIGDLLGLGLEQFTKLVLLPQGQFAAFLRAGAEERRQLLERLFGTDRFTRVQEWLRERARIERQKVEEAERETDRLLARAREVASALPPPSEDETPDGQADGETVAGDGGSGVDPDAELRALADHLENLLTTATERRTRTHRASTAASTERERVRALADRQAEHTRLSERQRVLTGLTDEVERARRRLRDAERAAAFTSVATGLRDSRRHRDEAAAAFTRSAEELHGADRPSSWPEPPDVPARPEGTDTVTVSEEHLTGWLHAARAERERLSSVLPRLTTAIAESRALTEWETRIDRYRGEAERAERAYRAASERGESIADRRVQLEQRLIEAERLTETVDRARTDRAAAQDVVEAVLRREDLHQGEVTAREHLAEVRQRRDELKEHWLTIRERRLDGIAAELAAGLSEGGPCPVCGSTDHPAPAEPGDRPRIDDAAEERAKAEVDVADRVVEAAAEEQARLAVELAAAVQAARGKDRESAERIRADADTRLAEAEQAVAASTDLTRQRRELDAEAGTAAQEMRQAEQTHRQAQDDLAEAIGSARTVRTRIAELAEDLPEPTGPGTDGLVAVETVLRARATAVEAVLETGQDLAKAVELLAASTRQAAEAAAGAGFDDPQTALAAVLDEDRVAELTGFVTATSEELATVTDRLADADLIAAATTPPADPEAAERAEQAARAEDEDAAALVTRATTASTAVKRLSEELSGHLARGAPVVERSRELTELARCADGTGGDNALRMSLSAYVLAARLEQVARAASQRLSAMSGGRYTLTHSDGDGHGRGRSGLVLQVLDGWTGAQRPTGTLSGGESFYASLSLALGLADVVTAESGGAAVETLFIDEGFGSLDEQALDEVMDVLDELRAGGRAVGLVSHVSDLRDRIPAQLRVVKTRQGSRLSQLTG